MHAYNRQNNTRKYVGEAAVCPVNSLSRKPTNGTRTTPGRSTGQIHIRQPHPPPPPPTLQKVWPQGERMIGILFGGTITS